MLVRHSLLCCMTLTYLIIGRPEQAQACVQIMPGVCFHTRSVFTGGYAPGSGGKKSSQSAPQSSTSSSTGDTIVGVLQALIGTQKELATSRQSFQAKYGKLLFEGKSGSWILSGKGNAAGKECAASFLPSSSSSSAFVSFFGPDKKLPGAILFQGTAIPVVDQPKEVRVILSTNDAPPATIRVFQIPIAQDKSAILMPTDMIVTMRGTTETTWMTLQLDGKEVFRTDMAGIMTARDAMLKCMQTSQ